MPSKAKVRVTKVRTVKTAKVGKSRNKSGGNPNKCPIYGKFMGSGSGICRFNKARDVAESVNFHIFSILRE